MNGKEQIEKEISRLQRILDGEETPDPIEVAIVEAYKDSLVQEILIPILDGGAEVNKISKNTSGTMTGIVQFDFNTKWKKGSTHNTMPPIVSALVEISPPVVLKVVKRDASTLLDISEFTLPQNRKPFILSNLPTSLPFETQEFILKLNTKLTEYLDKENLQETKNKLESIDNAIKKIGLTTLDGA
ncbi:MAG: hypothetical protein ACFFC7_29055 [Candidatus Hermodarchaeota archaeon]